VDTDKDFVVSTFIPLEADRRKFVAGEDIKIALKIDSSTHCVFKLNSEPSSLSAN
jgi:hypothetical protein